MRLRNLRNCFIHSHFNSFFRGSSRVKHSQLRMRSIERSKHFFEEKKIRSMFQTHVFEGCFLINKRVTIWRKSDLYHYLSLEFHGDCGTWPSLHNNAYIKSNLNELFLLTSHFCVHLYSSVRSRLFERYLLDSAKIETRNTFLKTATFENLSHAL